MIQGHFTESLSVLSLIFCSCFISVVFNSFLILGFIGIDLSLCLVEHGLAKALLELVGPVEIPVMGSWPGIVAGQSPPESLASLSRYTYRWHLDG